MNDQTAAALARTLLLMRDELDRNVTDEQLLDSLATTSIVLVADKENLRSHSAQTAFVTAAMLMARSAQQVHILAPDVLLAESQPPLIGKRLVTALVAASNNLVPGVALSPEPPTVLPDIEIRFGDSPSRVRAKRSIVLTASGWGGNVAESASRWPALDWPLGGLAAAALAGGEAFKASMMKLSRWALNPAGYGARFAPCAMARLDVAPPSTPPCLELGSFNVISAGAIANSFLYSLLRLRDARGSGRVIDADIGDISNLNRNVLMLYSDIQLAKVISLANQFTGSVMLESVPRRFDAALAQLVSPASRIIVGVDHIPTRWVAQERNPSWLGIGATSHWSAMASFHTPELACARCLHPNDDADDTPVPTVAFVSFWAGLLVAGYFAHSLVNRGNQKAQQTYLTPLRPEVLWRTAVARRVSCQLCGVPRRARFVA